MYLFFFANNVSFYSIMFYRSTGRITDLDTLLAVLEAKLNSIPMDTTTTTATTTTATTTAVAVASSEPSPSTTTPTMQTSTGQQSVTVPTEVIAASSVVPSPPPPPPPPVVVPVAAATAPVLVHAALIAESPSANAGATAGGGMCVKDHPDYEGFFRMLKVNTTTYPYCHLLRYH